MRNTPDIPRETSVLKGYFAESPRKPVPSWGSLEDFSMVTESPSVYLSFRTKDEMSQDIETVSEESGWELES